MPLKKPNSLREKNTSPTSHFSYMGICFSSAIPLGPSAKIISLNGTLKVYPVPVKVAQVLEAETASSSSSSSFSSRSNCFLCNSDSLYFDKFIPALEEEDELDANQIYFVLPASKLEKRLTASDMAALAVKASVAIQNVDDGGYRKKNARITPVLLVNSSESRDAMDDDAAVLHTLGKANTNPNFKAKPRSKPALLPRSNSGKKLQKYASKRARLAVRSFRLRLSTIYEGTPV